MNVQTTGRTRTERIHVPARMLGHQRTSINEKEVMIPCMVTGRITREGQPDLIGVRLPGGSELFVVDSNEIGEDVYESSITVDHDACEFIEDSAEMLIDWLKSDPEGPFHVVTRSRIDKRSFTVTVTIGEDGRAQGVLEK